MSFLLILPTRSCKPSITICSFSLHYFFTLPSSSYSSWVDLIIKIFLTYLFYLLLFTLYFRVQTSRHLPVAVVHQMARWMMLEVVVVAGIQIVGTECECNRRIILPRVAQKIIIITTIIIIYFIMKQKIDGSPFYLLARLWINHLLDIIM